jgi:hypothetical protein
MRIEYKYRNVPFFIGRIIDETDQFIYFQINWAENVKGKRIEHTNQVLYDKNEPKIGKRFIKCTCSFHSNWGVNNPKWCIVIKVAAEMMIKLGRLDEIVREFVDDGENSN